MSRERRLSLESYRQFAEFVRIGNRAVHRAQEESRRLGVPNVFCHRDRLYYELPDGSLTTENPFADRSDPRGGKA